MAQDKPTLLPRWASSPPAAPPTTITEPTSAQKDSGWQPSGSAEFPDGHPMRQIANWLENLEYQWINWLQQSESRTSDQFADQLINTFPGNIPSLGVGLGPIAANDFSASVYVDGYRVPETASPIHTYNATSDTYWDLGRDGIWVAAVVASGGGAPAVATNAFRVFAVRTDATDRTALIVDNQSIHSQLDIDQITRYLVQLSMAARLNLGVNTDDIGTLFSSLLPKIFGTGHALAAEGPNQWSEFNSNNVAVSTMRTYGPGDAGPLNGWMMVWGARMTSPSAWVSDANADDVFRIVISGDSFVNQLRVQFGSIIGVGLSTAFNETDWIDQDVSGQLSQMNVEQGVRLGSALNAGAAATRNTIPQIEHTRQDANLVYTLIRADKTSTIKTREYYTSNPFGLGSIGRVQTWNASWDEATSLWNRDDNTADSFLRIDWSFGVYHLSHLTGGSNTWADTITPSTWAIMQAQGVTTGTTRNVAPAITLAAAFDPGQAHGYGQPIVMRRIFTAMHGQIDSIDQASGDGQFRAMDPGVTINALRAEFNAPGSDTELAIPFQMPHESIITKIEVLLWNNAANTPEIGVHRDDLNDLSGTGSWSSLQTAGNDAVIASSATRIWHDVQGLDTGLTINNIRYRYAITCLAKSGLQTFVQAARVTATVPYNAAF